MNLEDKLLPKASGVQSLSSSVHSTPEKNGHSDDASRTLEPLHEFVKYRPKKELRSCFDLEEKQSASSKSKMTEQLKTSNRSSKKQEHNKIASNCNSSIKKQPRKGENPTRLPIPDESSDFGGSGSWICKNSACRSRLSLDDAFCKRCSCCICHLFDENKDPSLWLECEPEAAAGYSCGLSCHIECALQGKKVGVVNLGQLMELDGNYCCTWCGKVSGILDSWKKQLIAAKDSRRVDTLRYRVSLSFRLLEGTSRFKEMLELVREAKEKLETEIGPLNEISDSMHRGIVSRLSVASDVQNLCSLAIDKVDDMLAIFSNQEKGHKGYSLPAACRFIFQEVTCSSVVVVLVELCNSATQNIKGYKLHYFKSRGEKQASEPLTLLPRSQRKILISNLQPCTEYTFEVVSYAESGDLGHSMTKCFTNSKEIINRNSVSSVILQSETGNFNVERRKEPGSAVGVSSLEFKVRDIGKVLKMAGVQDQVCWEGLARADVVNYCEASTVIKPETKERITCGPRNNLDLNVVLVPDLNEEPVPSFEFSIDRDNCCAISHDFEIEGQTRPRVSHDSQIWIHGPAAVESHPEPCKKRLASRNEEAHDCDSTLIENSQSGVSNGSIGLDENFEYCVKMIRWLECEGHINKVFRLKLLTWYSMRSTEQERRVVSAFVQTLIDDPSSLAAQLIDSFTDIIISKRPCNGHHEEGST